MKWKAKLFTVNVAGSKSNAREHLAARSSLPRRCAEKFDGLDCTEAESAAQDE